MSTAELTGEDAARAADRRRVHEARSGGRRLRLMWLIVGPGILAMLGENDGPSMLNYAQDGASYGVGFFVPFLFVTFLMSAVCQEMCMRIGAVTHRGYGELVLQRFGRAWGWFGAIDLLVTNLVTLIAEFVAVRVGLAYFGLPPWVAVVMGVALVATTITGGRYWRWERIVLGLALFNGLFLAAALAVGPDWSATGRALASFSPLPSGSLNTVLLLLAGTIGATVTPWMIFFQPSASADKGMTPRDIPLGRLDTGVGALLAAIFGVGALLAGAALVSHGGGAPGGVVGADFPHALNHSSGGTAGTLFALGLIEAGAAAILTISASTAYAAGECIGVAHSFNTGWRSALVFHGANLGIAAAAGAIILIPGAPLLSIALNANVLATVLLPVALIFLLLLANDRELMGRWVNRRWLNWVAGIIIAVVGLAGAAYGIDSFLRSVGLVSA